jgi:hypothetical protein
VSGIDTGRVWYFKLWSLELKFGGDLPLGVWKLWLKFNNFWTPFARVFYFSPEVGLC